MSSVENNLQDVIANLRRRIQALEAGTVNVTALSDLSGDLGIVTAGEFRSPADPANPLEPGEGFSGVRVCGEGMDYGGTAYAVVGVANDVLQFGLSSADGKAYAGGGAVVLDEDGVTILQGGYDINAVKWSDGIDNSFKISTHIGSTGSDIVAQLDARDTIANPGMSTLQLSATATGGGTTPSIISLIDSNVGISTIIISADEVNLGGAVTVNGSPLGGGVGYLLGNGNGNTVGSSSTTYGCFGYNGLGSVGVSQMHISKPLTLGTFAVRTGSQAASGKMVITLEDVASSNIYAKIELAAGFAGGLSSVACSNPSWPGSDFMKIRFRNYATAPGAAINGFSLDYSG